MNISRPISIQKIFLRFLCLSRNSTVQIKMKCRICNVEKLSREFPREPLTEECDHPALYCLRCVTNKVESEWKCPYDGCGKSIDKDNLCLKECKETLEFLFPVVSSACDDYIECNQDSNSSQQTIQVTMLTGEREMFMYTKSKTIRDLKEEIHQKMGIETGKQRLIYKDTELKISGGTDRKLSDFGVEPFSTIHLMILLYAIPEKLNHVVFELSWTYPSHGRDFLDASCLMFMKDEWYDFIDWRYKYGSAVTHSGDKMDDFNRKGCHRMEAKLKQIPLTASHLVFTLSSFKAPTIAAFKNPTMKFYDAANDKVQLCEATFDHTLNAQALIVCCISRQSDGTWRIDKGGQTSAGNAKTYRPLVKTIKPLIRMNYFSGVSLQPGKSLICSMTPEESQRFHRNCERRLVPGTKNIY